MPIFTVLSAKAGVALNPAARIVSAAAGMNFAAFMKSASRPLFCSSLFCSWILAGSSIHLAEIDIDHFRIGADRLGRIDCDDFAHIEDANAVADRHDETQIVIDHDKRGPRP